jgi:hypothetical protein
MSVVLTIMSGAMFMCIALVDNFYAESLPPENIMSGKHTVHETKNEEVYMHSEQEALEAMNS